MLRFASIPLSLYKLVTQSHLVIHPDGEIFENPIFLHNWDIFFRKVSDLIRIYFQNSAVLF